MPRTAILYDAECGFCKWSLGLCLRRDRHLLRFLPGGRPFAAVAHAMPGLTDRGYAFVAGHRTPLGRLLRRLRLRGPSDL